MLRHVYSYIFFFNDTATTEIYTLSLHDALPIFRPLFPEGYRYETQVVATTLSYDGTFPLEVLASLGASAALHISDIPFNGPDRKSTRLNSSHANISYAVFCLKKKKRSTPCTPVC